MKVKSIKTVEVKEIGAINLNNIEAVNGNLLVHIPISHANEGLEDLVNKLYKDFLEKHPDVDEEEICVDVNVQYTFGGWMTGINCIFQFFIVFLTHSAHASFLIYFHCCLIGSKFSIDEHFHDFIK